ncbi:MAG: type VII toxin-antitoxin system HepT family RNase toxin [Thermodesulfobacteriota bacterium]
MRNKINVERIKQFIGEVKESLRILRGYIPKGKEQILKDSTVLASIKYNLIVAIQGCIDICNHIVAKRGGRAPQDYGDCFRLMAELGILEESISNQLIQMTKFRNLLIHLYWEVDNERVYEILTNNLDDIDRFLINIGSFLKKEVG